MTLLVKADEQQVYMNINGDVYSEHINFLQDSLIERLHYGYRQIVLDVNDIRQFDDKGIAMLTYIRSKLHKLGGDLIINDKNGVISDLFFANHNIL